MKKFYSSILMLIVALVVNGQNIFEKRTISSYDFSDENSADWALSGDAAIVDDAGNKYLATGSGTATLNLPRHLDKFSLKYQIKIDKDTYSQALSPGFYQEGKSEQLVSAVHTTGTLLSNFNGNLQGGGLEVFISKKMVELDDWHEVVVHIDCKSNSSTTYFDGVLWDKNLNLINKSNRVTKIRFETPFDNLELFTIKDTTEIIDTVYYNDYENMPLGGIERNAHIDGTFYQVTKPEDSIYITRMEGSSGNMLYTLCENGVGQSQIKVDNTATTGNVVVELDINLLPTKDYSIGEGNNRLLYYREPNGFTSELRYKQTTSPVQVESWNPSERTDTYLGWNHLRLEKDSTNGSYSIFLNNKLWYKKSLETTTVDDVVNRVRTDMPHDNFHIYRIISGAQSKAWQDSIDNTTDTEIKPYLQDTLEAIYQSLEMGDIEQCNNKIASFFDILAGDINPVVEATEGQLDYYVSLDGNDGNDGSAAHPFLTLDKALYITRRQANTVGKPTIWLNDGEYKLLSSITLNNDDSGTQEHPFRIKAINKEHVTMTVLKTFDIDAFDKVTDTDILKRIRPEVRDQILELDLSTAGIVTPYWQTNMSAAEVKIPAVIYDGEHLPLSRYPNEGEMNIKAVYKNEPGLFEYRDDRHKYWLDAVEDGLWFQGYWRVVWGYMALQVESIDTTNRVVWQSAKVNGGIGNKYAKYVEDNLEILGHTLGFGESIQIGEKTYTFDTPVRIGNGKEPYIAINLIEEIDIQGEWCINFPRKKLYILPPAEADEIKIGDEDIPCISLTAASNIIIDGIHFTGGKTNAIEIDNSDNVRVSNCEIDHFMEYGVVVDGGNDNMVDSCTIHHMGAGGIILAGGDKSELISANHSAVYNEIYEFGQLKKVYAGGVELSAGSVGMYVAHNKIHGTPHVGVYYQDGVKHIMEYNEVYDICRVSNDMGAFYSYGSWTTYGNVVRYNYIHDSPLAHGWYADGVDSGDSVYCNIMYKIANGLQNSGGHDNICFSNIAVECERMVSCSGGGVLEYNYTKFLANLESVGYLSEPWITEFPSLVNIPSSANTVTPYDTEFTCNLSVNCEDPTEITPSQIESWGIVYENNEIIHAPEFENKSFTLKALMNSSYALNKSCLLPIDIDQIGNKIGNTCISTDDTLKTINVEGHELIPSFSYKQKEYTVEVLKSTDSVNIKATPNSYCATVEGIGWHTNLEEEATVSITAKDGTTQSTYTITFVKVSSDATLSTLHPGRGILNPSFKSEKTDYRVSLFPSDISEVTITAETTDANATISGDTGVFVLGDTAKILVTAEDGKTTKLYTIAYPKVSSINRLREVECKIYPNPTDNILTIELEKYEGETSIKVYSILGELVLSQITIDTTTNIDLSAHKNGIYFVAISTAKGMTTERIIKE